MAETLLTLRDVAVRHGEHVALQGASLEVYTGDVLALIGPNGAGKSTLLRVMGMLQRPDNGNVLFRGENALNGNSLELRRRIATVFQEPLLLNATVYQNAALGLKLRGVSRVRSTGVSVRGSSGSASRIWPHAPRARSREARRSAQAWPVPSCSNLSCCFLMNPSPP